MISVNLATYSKRKDILPACIESIKNQSVEPDIIRVWYNDYIPERDNSIEQHWNGMDYSDRGKFIWLDNIRYGSRNEIYFSADDDMIYPVDYIEKTLQGLQKYPRRVVSWHGRKLKGKGLSYYFGHTPYMFMTGLKEDKDIEVPGTGVSAFNTEHFIPDVIQYPAQCMADLLLGLEMAILGVKGVCLKHDSGWIRAMDADETIYKSHSRSEDGQTQIADEIWDIAQNQKKL